MNCGYEADDNAKFCIRCGAHFSEDSEDKNPKRRTERADGRKRRENASRAETAYSRDRIFPRLGSGEGGDKRSARSGRETTAVGTDLVAVFGNVAPVTEEFPSAEDYASRRLENTGRSARRRQKRALRSAGRYFLRWRSWDCCSTFSAASVF